MGKSRVTKVSVIVPVYNVNLNFLQYPKIQIDNLQNRKFYIWGAGGDSMDTFWDSNPQVKEFQEYNILLPDSLLKSANRQD